MAAMTFDLRRRHMVTLATAVFIINLGRDSAGIWRLYLTGRRKISSSVGASNKKSSPH